MSKQTEALKLALEALLINCGGNTEGIGKEAITAIKQALPAAQRQSARSAWVGLTDKEIADAATSHPLTWVNLNVVEHRNYFARAIEAKLKAKNSL